MLEKRIILVLLGVIFSLVSFANISEAANVDIQSLGPNARQESIATIAAFTAKGDMPQLKDALIEGLDSGLTVNEIKEVLVQMYAYCGFPRSLNGINTFMGVIKEREAKGINDVVGREPNSLPEGKNRLELGTEIQTALRGGVPATGAIYTFAPAIDAFLKDHLFGDIFGRDNLDFQSREIATISALASMGGVNSQLQAHFDIGFNVGLTEPQMRSILSVLEVRVGKQEADSANEVLGKALSSRAK